MKRLIVLALLAFAGWHLYQKHEPIGRQSVAPQGGSEARRSTVQPSEQPIAMIESVPEDQFRCDGRTRCPQMTSCPEAMFFLQNCHGATMDGDGDGRPCEGQWCGH